MPTPQILKRLALSDNESSVDDSRTINFVFSTSNIASDMHRILPGAWQSRGHDGLADFRANPVFLWAHDASQPAIGKVTSLLADRDGTLRGTVQFADHPFADTVYQLYRNGFQRGASVSFEPLDWNYASGTDRAQGALDFTRVKLWEISAVPLPADSSALAAARALGFKVFTEGKAMPRNIQRATAEWKCGASRNLPVDTDSDWDGPAAAASVFEACGFDGDKPDTTKARKAFLAYDASAPDLKGSYKLPFAKMVGGRMTAVASGLRAAASRLSATEIPEDAKTEAQAVIDHYKDKMGDDDAERAVKVELTKRGLYEVASLANILEYLGWIKFVVDTEEEQEGDTKSAGPANMTAILQAVGKGLVEMAEEEVAELIAGFGPLEIDEEDDLGDEERAARSLDRMRNRLGPRLARSGRRLSKDDADTLEGIHDHARRGAGLCQRAVDNYRDADLSDSDTRTAMNDDMQTAADHSEQTRCMVRSYIDARKQKSNPDPVDPAATGDDAADERARRARRAKAMQRRVKLAIVA